MQVGGLTIKLIFNKDAKWTKALKYMLTDLKCVLKWFVEQKDGASASKFLAMPHSLAPSMASSVSGF